MSTATTPKPKQITLPIVYVKRTPDARTSNARTAVGWCVIARDHVGEFEVAWNHSKDRMRILACRVKDAIRHCKGRQISDKPPPCLDQPEGAQENR